MAAKHVSAGGSHSHLKPSPVTKYSHTVVHTSNLSSGGRGLVMIFPTMRVWYLRVCLQCRLSPPFPLTLSAAASGPSAGAAPPAGGEQIQRVGEPPSSHGGRRAEKRAAATAGRGRRGRHPKAVGLHGGLAPPPQGGGVRHVERLGAVAGGAGGAAVPAALLLLLLHLPAQSHDAHKPPIDGQVVDHLHLVQQVVRVLRRQKAGRRRRVMQVALMNLTQALLTERVLQRGPPGGRRRRRGRRANRGRGNGQLVRLLLRLRLRLPDHRDRRSVWSGGAGGGRAGRLLHVEDATIGGRHFGSFFSCGKRVVGCWMDGMGRLSGS